ncbi:MAG: diaminopimelate decarboxylase [Acidiphilium sp. 37-64-53]|uniref:diaminopimelate decarboxylase n=1 Tax=Acidiphilium TaxID=522 RepID=UPI000BD13AA7|nr:MULTISPECIES: diaminopimelate decarboxylase [Acidiphilium]OYW03009.1 MAG: diaminopimelate decarboxylase [Acidiphilium sp. 37-64-53]OZB29383.1 MAG: diaminopimelate decarboxylase [Acidiphilium sp. 34-64-41]HQT84333.1 diaminopimelate decarboxylase [Acidiphilium rubrum]
MNDAPDLARDQPWHRLIAARRALAWHAMDGLCLDDVPLAGIAARHGTPTWIYSAATLRSRMAALQGEFAAQGLTPAIRYAIKANDHLAILSLLRAGGAGADVTSAGEFGRAAAAGIDPAAMVYSGVGKRAEEIIQAIEAGIGQINVESAEELAMIAALARARDRTAPVALRINPDVAAGGHDKISTGRATDKFGIAYQDAAALYRHAATLAGIRPVGFSTHIGSQIFEIASYEAAYTRILALIDELNAAGTPVTMFDLGGGFGIPYDDGIGFPLPAYAAMVRRILAGRDLGIVIEPGRWLVAPAGLLLARVTLTKATEADDFVILDAGMNDLLRPALYDAVHGIVPVGAVEASGWPRACEVVGPVCESSDRFGRYDLPPLAPGALVAILDAGAYGAAMSSTYNGRPLAAQVLIDRGQPHVIRMRQSIEQLWRDEIIPPA